MVKLSSYINVLHPKKFEQFLADEKEFDQTALLINLFLITVFSLFTQFYSAIIRKTATSGFTLFSIIWPAMGLFVLCSILNFIATRFGAKSNLPKLLYLLSILMVSVNLITLPLYLIMPSADSKLALVGCLIIIPIVIIALYSLYREYKVFSSQYPTLSGNQPIIAYLVSLGVVFLISFVLVLVFKIS